MYVQLSSGVRALIFGLSLHICPCVCASSDGSGIKRTHGQVHLKLLYLHTVNSEIFMKILFSRIVIKDIFATLKLRN